MQGNLFYKIQQPNSKWAVSIEICLKVAFLDNFRTRNISQGK
jgi:hypothetical protein